MRERDCTIDGKIVFDTSLLCEAEKQKFIKGWEEAGGYMGDCDGSVPVPWCMPWLRGNPWIETGQHDLTPAQLGKVHWENCKDEIAKLLAEEAEGRREA